MLACYSIYNGLSLKIFDVEYGINDYVLCGYDRTCIEKCKIEYNEEYDDFYFFYNGTTYYLSDFIRNVVI